MSGRKFTIVVDIDDRTTALTEIRAAEEYLADHIDVDVHPIFGEDPCYGQPIIELCERGLSITDDGGYSNIQQTCSVIQWLLAKPGAPDHVFFEWSADDDDGYYGGCAYVTATGFVAHRTDHWFEQMRDELASQHAPERTLRERLGETIVGLDCAIADSCDVDDLLATPDSRIAETPFLSVESGNDGLWLSLHATVADAAEANYQQEYASDWNLDTIIDVRDGSRWGATPTWTAYPATDNTVTIPPTTEAP